MSATVTTATVAALASSISSLGAAAAIGIAALLLLLVFMLEKEVLASTSRLELAVATRYLNVVTVPLFIACALIAVFRLGVAAGVIR